MPLPSIIEGIKMAEKHLQMAIDWKEKVRGLETRRHYSNYFREYLTLKYRTIMVTADHSDELFALFNELKKEFSPQPVFN